MIIQHSVSLVIVTRSGLNHPELIIQK